MEASDLLQSTNCNSTASKALANFLDLPSELRNTIFETILLESKPIDPWRRCVLEIPTQLFCASKAIHREASSLFYGQNRFDFSGRSSEELALFLRQIGTRNATLIRHAVIDFPAFLYLDPGDITLKEESVSILANIHSSCTNLSTLTTSLHSTQHMEFRLDNLEHYKLATEALDLVDAHFRDISREILLEVYEDGPSDSLRRRMESYGWILSKIPFVEDEQWNRSESSAIYIELYIRSLIENRIGAALGDWINP